MISVTLTKEQHQVYTNMWRKKNKYGSNYKNYTVQDLLVIAKDIYKDEPRLFEILEASLKGGT
jgi:hypothetical protein